MKTTQKGFAVLEVLLVLVIVGMIAGTGWYTFHTKNQTDKILAEASNSAQSVKSNSNASSSSTTSTQKVTLDSGNVVFVIPSGWQVDSSGSSDCLFVVTSKIQSCLDGAILGVTSLGPASDFSVTASVFDLGAGNTNPEIWFGQDYQGGGPSSSENDATSSAPINGQSAWRFEQNVSGDQSYQDQHYVIIAKDKVVYVYARTKEENTSGALNIHDDFSQYLPNIQSLVNSIKIN